MREAWRRMSRRAALTRLRLTRHTMRVPERLIVAPTDLRSIDPFFVEELLNGRILLAGRVLETEGKSPFALELPSQAFAARLHSFRWLRHLRAEKSDQASALARAILNDWMAVHGRRLHGIAWSPDIAAQRLIAWLSHSPVVLQGTDGGFYRRFMRMLVFHVRYLRRVAATTRDGETRFRVRIALAMSSVAMPNGASTLKRAGQALDREIDRQILPDGGHISRNPRVALELLLDLLPLRQTYVNLGHDAPARLIPGIDRMYPALRFFRHQDGDLALFNGATSTLANELMSVLRYDETAGQVFKALPHTKYHRLAAGQAVVIIDTGAPASADLSRTAHAGCLSFEMSSGKSRFIVNSGSPNFAGDRYVQAARATAAHSTVTLDDTSSSLFSRSKALGPVMVGGVKKVIVERAETEDGRDYVRAVHDGYLSTFGYAHEREVSLNAAGTILAGRDRFFVPEGKKSLLKSDGLASARFHVHPSISLLQTETDAALLIAPDGETWVFSSPGNEVLVTEDIFFADASGMRSSDQLEIVFPITEKPEIRWFLSHRP
ncbi:heparinase II/III family protein [Rhizobium sp. CB3171]|uniref:heparinase II/III family protein n=1 Tax=Rhizobium sp. CB3171 TaxID=3039157 RepID=UPI0024B20629|nr:heparinase II/III family protein [Rhizobium sp. CB3171]WFU01772.1 heparinase II/III family protein [Rhizobium sp. CB3171]